MENLELTIEEKKELEKRGFFAKKKISLIWLSKQVLILSALFFLFTGFILLNYQEYTVLWQNISLIIIGILWIIFSVLIMYNYIISRITFYGKMGIIWYGKIQQNDISIIQKDRKIIQIFNKILGTFKVYGLFVSEMIEFINKSWSSLRWVKSMDTSFIFLIIIFSPIIFISWGIVMWWEIIGKYIWLWVTWFELSFFLWIFSILIIIPISILLSEIVNKFHPLYVFGNLWEKIQKLTPKIEEQSRLIQSEFHSDMNYSVLRTGFDSLSATFSNIITLVIKLEKVETRANKWNLFDSEKYINSLRSDIVTPLTSLKIFLEIQKTELMKSEKELTRVRVWGNESTGNIDLQFKRSEPLIVELTENIEKLDMMIGKMG